MKLVSSLDNARKAIVRLNRELPDYPELADRLGLAHAFYALENGGDVPLFGFSKFVGYDALTPKAYLKNSSELDGRNTEHALKTWFEEVTPDTPEYRRLYDHLETWLATYGKRPRNGKNQKVRIMVVKPEFREDADAAREDRRLLDLMLAVADLLPATQRHQLRAAL